MSKNEDFTVLLRKKNLFQNGLQKILKENDNLRKKLENIIQQKNIDEKPKVIPNDLELETKKNVKQNFKPNENTNDENKKLRLEVNHMKSEIKDLKIQVKNLVEILENILVIKN